MKYEFVHALYADRLGEMAATIAIAPGESSKTLASAERVWRSLLEAGMTRADHLVALGGGVVGDLAGFAAATYNRGLPLLMHPIALNHFFVKLLPKHFWSDHEAMAVPVRFIDPRHRK